MRPWQALFRAIVLMAVWPGRCVSPASSSKSPTGVPMNSAGAGSGGIGITPPGLPDQPHDRDSKRQTLLKIGPNTGEGARGAGGLAEPRDRGFWGESRGRQPPTQSPWDRRASAARGGEDAEQWEPKRGLERGSVVGVEAWRHGARSLRPQHSGGDTVHNSRNWCAYVLTRIATSVVINGTETFVATVAEPCPWGHGSCQTRHTSKQMTRPTYRIKHSIVTSLQWKCCPGHTGPACDLTEPAVGTARSQEPASPSQRVDHRQSDEHVTLDSVSEELVIDLVRKLLDERLGDGSRRPGHGSIDVSLSAPSASKLAEALQLVQRSLSAINATVSEQLDDLARRLHGLEKMVWQASEQQNALLLEQEVQRALAETWTRHVADKAQEAAEAREALVAELRADLGRMWKFATDRLDAVNLTIAGLQLSGAPYTSGVTNNAAASKPAAETSDGGGDGGSEEGEMKGQRSDAQKGKVVSAQDFGRFNETMKRHEYLLRDVYNQLHLFTEKLKELSYRIQDEQEASWGECTKLQDAFKASEDSLSFKLQEVQEQLLNMNKTVVIGLSPVEERFDSVLSTIHNLSTEVGHLQESLQRRVQGTDWLDEAQSLREQMESLILSVQSLKIDVEDLKFSRTMLGPGVRLPGPNSALESRVNGTEIVARTALEQSRTLAHNVSQMHRRVEQLSSLGLNLLTQASITSQHIDHLNDSFNTLMEDTLRHTLALEELGAFRDSDYDGDYDGDYGGGKSDAKAELNLVKLSRLLSETASTVREQSDLLLATRSRLLALQLQVANATASTPRALGYPRGAPREEAAGSLAGDLGSPEDDGGIEHEGREVRLWERLARLESAWLEMDGQRLGRLESRLNEMAGVAAGCVDRTDALREHVEREAAALQRTLATVAASRDAQMEALRRDLLAELSAYVEAAMRARRKDKDERRQQRKETVTKQQQQRAGKAPAAVHGVGSEPGAASLPEPAHLREAAQRGARQLVRAKATHARTTWSIAAAPRAPADGGAQRPGAP